MRRDNTAYKKNTVIFFFFLGGVGIFLYVALDVFTPLYWLSIYPQLFVYEKRLSAWGNLCVIESRFSSSNVWVPFSRSDGFFLEEAA